MRKRSSHEIPNSQVLDAAREFKGGFELLIGQPPGSGLVLPALHCASIALELYLKSLSAQEVEVPDDILTGSVFIYAKSPSRSHELEGLFDEAPADLRQLMEEAAAQSPRLHGFSGIRNAFATYSPMFMSSRYPFEPGRDLQVVIDTLRELVQLLEHLTRSIPPRWITDTP